MDGINYCIKCGSELNPDANFCIYCGNSTCCQSNSYGNGHAGGESNKRIKKRAWFYATIIGLAVVGVIMIFVAAATTSGEATAAAFSSIMSLVLGIGLCVGLGYFLISRAKVRKHFFIPSYYSREAIIHSATMAFCGRGYFMTGSCLNSATYVKTKRPSVIIGVLLLLLWLIPGILYLVFFNRQKMGAVSIIDAPGGHNVVVDGPKAIADGMERSFALPVYDYAPAGYIQQQRALPPGS